MRLAVPGDFEKYRKRLGIPLKYVRAVMQVEAGGKTSVAGRIVIRFEPHVFLRDSAKKILRKLRVTKEEQQSHGLTVLLPGMKAPTAAEGRQRFVGMGASTKRKQAEEYAALAKAGSLLDPETAHRSTSFGIAQIMGFNYKVSGYRSAVEMAGAFQVGGKEEQQMAFLRFVRNFHPALLPAIKSGDFETFARIYNGDTTGRYAGRMQKASEAFA